jgi:hypothetical protein
MSWWIIVTTSAATLDCEIMVAVIEIVIVGMHEIAATTSMITCSPSAVRRTTAMIAVARLAVAAADRIIAAWSSRTRRSSRRCSR